METCKAIIDVGKEWQISKMCDLVKGLIKTTVGIDMESPGCLTPLYVYQKVVNWKKPGEDAAVILKVGHVV